MEVKEKLNEQVKTLTLLPGAQMSELKIKEKKVIKKIKSNHPFYKYAIKNRKTK